MDYDNELNIDYKEAYKEIARYLDDCCRLLNCNRENAYRNLRGLRDKAISLNGQVSILKELTKEYINA